MNNMEVEFKDKPKKKTFKYNQLEAGVVYKCITYHHHVYKDAIIMGCKFGGIYGIWLTVDNTYLGNLTNNLEYLEFEEFKCKLVEL